MKKHGIVFAVYAAAAAAYAAVSIVLTDNKGSTFWLGFGFALFSFAAASVITYICAKKRGPAFPLDISITVFSAIYIVAVLCVNMLAGYVLKAASDVFLCIHVICLAIYAVIISILFTVKGAAARQRSVEDGRICEKQILIYEFEKIRSKVAEMNGSVRDSAAHMIDSLLEELRFSDLASFADVSDSDDMIGKRAQILSAEVDNLIAIDSTDLSGMEAAVNDIRRMIRDRNSQIRLMSQNI